MVLIKLAERTQTLRALMTCGDEASAQRKRSRTKTRASSRRWPTASASGSSSGSWRTCRCASWSPRLYKKIAKLLDERRLDRERYIADVVVDARSASSTQAGIQAEVTGRPKHIYSIWNKMQRKRSGFRRDSTTCARCACWWTT